MTDAEARKLIGEDLATTLFVEAAAGTGKTTALVGRVVALLRSGLAELETIVAVTFTEKAAGEMKLRVREEIEKDLADESVPKRETARLRKALEQLELARIGTIHAFCGDLLHERPVEAGVDPLFEVAPQDESTRLLDRAFDGWFQRCLADPPEGVRRVLRRRPRGFDGQGPRDLLRTAAGSLVEHRDFPEPWRRDPFEREATIDAVMEQLASLGALASRAGRSDDYLARGIAEVRDFVAETQRLEAVRGRDYDGLEAALRSFVRQRSWGWRGFPSRPYGPDLPREEVIARRDAVKQSLEELLADCDADLAALLHEELRPVVAEYEALKQRGGVLDFLDLLVRARDLIAGDCSVREGRQKRFTHYFVDEFQDTDPLQAEILLLLAADDPAADDWRRVTTVPGKLFLVGDPKQSIYRFRRADVVIYEETKRMLVASGARVVHLSKSFRAAPSLQAAVNSAFAPRMGGGEGSAQAAYVPLEPSREEVEGQPTLVALPVPEPYRDYGNRARIVNFEIERSMPVAVGAFVDWLIHHSGWTVSDREHPGTRVPIQPRHVCLLLRRFRRFQDDVTRPYVRALEVRDVPHVLVGGRSFHEREEVLAIRNALCAIEWPDDELRLYATLRGPLFALGDDQLLAYRNRMGSLHPLRRVDAQGEKVAGDKLDDAEREVAVALEVLARLHVMRNRRPIAHTLERLLEAVRAHAGIAIWPTGEQALANCLRTIDLARRFERRGAASFRAFAEHMESEAERGEVEDAPVVEEGTEGVRIMTVHRAKGLEFPVVILADPTCRAWREPPSRHVEPERGLWAEPLCGCAPRDLLDAREQELGQDQAEAVRLAYVAATRARDLLVVPVLGEPRSQGSGNLDEGWLEVLDSALYPAEAARRSASAAPGCPLFGEDTAVDRPKSARMRPEDAVAPGLHTAVGGDHGVVWWDPNVLELGRQEQVGLKQQQILEADAAGTVAEEGERKHAEWQAERAEALRTGGEPSLQVIPVTALVEEDVSGVNELEVVHEVVPLERTGRPAGARFGTLVHAILAAVDLGADAAQVAAVAGVQGRLVGASALEVDAATTAVGAALAHPLLRRAAASDALRRETPVLLRRPDGSLAEGVLDLAFREADASGGPCWTVVDFKTDRELETRRSLYEAQVRLYAQGVASATGERVRGVLLTV